LRRRIRIGRSRNRRRSAIRLLRELPNFFRLLIRLMRDPRVSRFDRILFGVVMTYVLVPADLIPDMFGFLGLADDLYLIGLALNRLFSHAGSDLLLEHWEGNPRALGYVIEGVEEIGALLPRRIRQTLRGFV
jgi:uncharacterized membrane protein YkvA (DUF1232 family)